MSNPKRILTGLIIAVLIVGAGLAAGYYFQSNPAALKKIASVAKPQSQQKKTSEPNHNTYEISPPSRGAAITKFPIEITPQNDEATVTAPADAAANVKTGQDVLLYSADGMLLEILGEVKSITPAKNDSVMISIKLNGAEGHPSDIAVRGDIVTEHISQAERLPLTAIVKDERGEPYLWEVIQNEDGISIAYYKAANILASTYDFYIIQQPDSVSNVFILNPDDKLSDGQKINTRKILFSAQPITDDKKVRELVAARIPSNFVDPYAGRALATGCGGGDSTVNATPGAGCGQASSGGTSGSGCGTGGPDVIQDFIKKIRDNSPAQAPVS